MCGGLVTNRYRYPPVGAHELVQESALATTLLNWGREWDREVHLLYLRNRWYEPGTGRFVSEDPLGLSGGSIPTSTCVMPPGLRSSARRSPEGSCLAASNDVHCSYSVK
ncbi:hypothetical protein BH23GEM7_BH23GEM7_28940 [soil metagenome]